MDETKLKKMKELLEAGMATGEIFMYEIGELLKNNKHLFVDEIDYRKNEIMIRHMSSATLQALMDCGIKEELWPEFLMIMSRHAELMLSEGKRIAERHRKDKGNGLD